MDTKSDTPLLLLLLLLYYYYYIVNKNEPENLGWHL
jgi:hypothetical protein